MVVFLIQPTCMKWLFVFERPKIVDIGNFIWFNLISLTSNDDWYASMGEKIRDLANNKTPLFVDLVNCSPFCEYSFGLYELFYCNTL